MSFKNPNIVRTGKRRGRPPGSKTRPDAPSKLKQAAIASQKQNEPPKIASAPSANSGQAAPPANSGQAAPDTELFGDIKPATDIPVNVGNESIIPDESPLAGNTEGSASSPHAGSASSPHDGSASSPHDRSGEPAPEPKASDAEAQRPLVSLAVDSVLNFLATFVGAFWHPRPVGNDEGQVPYDERERLIVSGCRWFASMAIEALSPAQAFAMECFNYSLPRLKQTYDWFKLRFMKKAKPTAQPGQQVNDPRMAGTGETVDIKTEVKV
jgi:hypothetical protein